MLGLSELPIFQIRKQSPLENRVEDWIGRQTNKIIDDGEWVGEKIEWEEAWRDVIYNLQHDFDRIDEDNELTNHSREDEPEKWENEKLLILNFLKKL